jgi:hypothetical protein
LFARLFRRIHPDYLTVLEDDAVSRRSRVDAKPKRKLYTASSAAGPGVAYPLALTWAATFFAPAIVSKSPTTTASAF